MLYKTLNNGVTVSSKSPIRKNAAKPSFVL